MSKRLERFSLTQTLAWIAFRDLRLVTKDPYKLRRDMRRLRKRVVDANPAKDFLRVMRGPDALVIRAGNPVTGYQRIDPGAWNAMTEAELWSLAERQWESENAEIRVKYEPTLRCKFVADDGREFTDLVAFGEWMDTLPEDKRHRILETGKLDAEMCHSFWDYIGRTDTTPRELMVYVNADDADDWWKQIGLK